MSTRYHLQMAGRSNTPDDEQLFAILNDASGGMNTRMHSTQIGRNQFYSLKNVSLDVPGQRKQRPGSSAIANDVGNNACKALFNYERQGDTDYLVLIEGTTLHTWVSGAASWTSRKTDFTDTDYASIVAVKESGLSPDDCIVIQNGTENAFRINFNASEVISIQDLGNNNESPPKSRVMAWYNNRLWVLSNDGLYYSDAYPTDYSGAFDRTTGYFRIPVGEEKAIVATRDLGMIVFGRNAVWALSPSSTPDASTDQPQPITTSFGCVAENTAVLVGDDIIWLAQDGVRSLKRTEQDKLQTGSSFPLSYNLKEEYEDISWAYINKACAIYFDNKYFIALPTNAGTYNNKVWVYWPAYDAWAVITGWNVGAWSKFKVDGEERLYYADATDGQVYRAWDTTAYEDEGIAIDYEEISRKEDFGYPQHNKSGGEIEIEAQSASATLTVYAKINGGSFQSLGDMSLSTGDAPSLPVTLPFTLSDAQVIREKFHLDLLGRFKSIEIKIINEEVNTEDIIIHSINLVTFPEEYENE